MPSTKYQAIEISTIEHVFQYFENDEANEYNLLFLSTGGIHGTLCNLKDVKRGLDGGEEYSPYITVLILQPYSVRTFYGTVRVRNIKQLQRLEKISLSTAQVVTHMAEHNRVEAQNE